MSIKFTKMHGLGNDFMVIDCVNQSFEPTKKIIKQWSDRHFGIGFDQLLLVEPADTEQAEFKYRIFNADGGEVEQCGNGARCFARFVREKSLTTSEIIPVETASGLITLTLINDSDVRVDMGEPQFEPNTLPINTDQKATYDIDYQGETISFSAISMGNPHAVIEVNDVETASVNELGAFIQAHELFPQSVNVGFMQIIDENTIKCRVFERGVGETIACGTGACAAMVAGRLSAKLSDNVTVQLRGGSLDIQWQGGDSSVLMTGPTASVFDAEINI